MKYVIVQPNQQMWVGVSGNVVRLSTMCYKDEKLKWFNSLKEAMEHANKVADNPLWERLYSDNTISICKAIIERHTTENGKPYTTVHAGEVVKKVALKKANLNLYW